MMGPAATNLMRTVTVTAVAIRKHMVRTAERTLLVVLIMAASDLVMTGWSC